MKIPILKFIYYTYLESEKIPDEFLKYDGRLIKFYLNNCVIDQFLKYIQIETIRLNNIKTFKLKFCEYFFECILKNINNYMRIFLSNTLIDSKN